MPITRFGGPEVLEVVDLPEPEPGDGEKLFAVSTAGINYADTHQSESRPTSRMTTASPRNAGSPISTTNWR